MISDVEHHAGDVGRARTSEKDQHIRQSIFMPHVCCNYSIYEVK
jgi:hypothetical protein